jgi:hypothetical protein
MNELCVSERKGRRKEGVANARPTCVRGGKVTWTYSILA